MADEATLSVRLKTIIDESFLVKSLRNVSKKASKGSAIGIPSSGSSSSSGIEKTLKSIESILSKAFNVAIPKEAELEEAPEQKGSAIKGIGVLLGKGMKSMGSLLKTAGKGIAIVVGLAAALGPGLKMIGMLSKTVGEFLRPISDIMVVLLSPVLSLLRPILKVFKTLMAPFKQAAMQGMAAANMLMSQGGQLIAGGDKAGGSALIAEGMQASLSSASLLFSGFTQVIMSPLADLLGMGDKFDGMMADWQSAALDGVHRGIILSGTVRELNAEWGDLGLAGEGALAMIDSQMSILRSQAGKFTVDNFKEQMKLGQDTVDAAGAIVAGDLDGIKASADELNVPFEKLMGYMKTGTEDLPLLNSAFDTLIQNFTDAEKAATKYANNQRVGEVGKENEPGLLAKYMSGGKNIAANIAENPFSVLLGPAGMIKPFIDGWKNAKPAAIEAQKGLVEDTKAYWLSVDTLNDAGMSNALKNTESYYGEKGTIPMAQENGFQTMSKSTKNYVSSMKDYSSSMESLVSKSIKNAKRLASEAKSYANARDKYERKLKNLSSVRS